MITLYELRQFYRPSEIEEKDMGNKDKVARYVEASQYYMTFLEGIVMGLQSRISEEKTNE